ncbi:family 43 glycosylhydrolase [Pontibacter akesuensis]|uniref:Beta-xylosidase n=1 Tax=Pontibacter akesuensis TaxID=388950 RepID=A0A1I7JD14_9BACT|nr:family 43 glycosylhydrolase [Pontibacter akesuensis]GHA70827.1 beta-xylosidase [Pontibacter akesuensis]SFU83058.1 Beta-xylosidase [Pontibacter akesuensis]
MKKHLFLSYLVALVAFSCTSNTATNEQETAVSEPVVTQTVAYTNPVLPGDYADPSVVRVGDDYWATATSSEWAPLYPILHSKNLVDWETVGHVFPDKMPDWAEAHFWAPEIAYENGKYYIYYTAKKKGGSLCVGVASATSATGPYTDHGPLVCQEVGSIDGFEIRDKSGELYLVWKEDGNSRGLPTPIWAQRMNEERTALTGEKFEMFRNDPGTWEGGLVEGPAIVQRGDYFYTFYAGDKCCGRECTYGVGVARAKTLKGPWEKYDQNPIMKQSNTWKCPGHGTVVTDQSGRDYFLYHAYSTDGFVYPGRQGLLDEIKWGENGWPYFENNAPSATAQVAAPEAATATAAKNLDVKEEFEADKLANTWQWPVTQQPSYAFNNGMLLLKASPDKIGTVLGKRTLEEDYTATAALDKSALQGNTMAGLTAIGDNDNAVGIGVSNGEIIIWSMKGGAMQTIAKTAAPKEETVQLQLTANNGDQMQFAWSTDGTTWNSLNGGKAVDASYLPPWDRGVRVGLTAKGPTSAIAAFDWFRVDN